MKSKVVYIPYLFIAVYLVIMYPIFYSDLPAKWIFNLHVYYLPIAILASIVLFGTGLIKRLDKIFRVLTVVALFAGLLLPFLLWSDCTGLGCIGIAVIGRVVLFFTLIIFSVFLSFNRLLMIKLTIC